MSLILYKKRLELRSPVQTHGPCFAGTLVTFSAGSRQPSLHSAHMHDIYPSSCILSFDLAAYNNVYASQTHVRQLPRSKVPLPIVTNTNTATRHFPCHKDIGCFLFDDSVLVKGTGVCDISITRVSWYNLPARQSLNLATHTGVSSQRQPLLCCQRSAESVRIVANLVARASC